MAAISKLPSYESLSNMGTISPAFLQILNDTNDMKSIKDP